MSEIYVDKMKVWYPTMVAELNGCDGKVISFAGRALKLDTAEHAELIVSELLANTRATCLNLSGNTLGIEAAKPVGHALEKLSNLNCCLFSDLFTGRLKSEIAPALKHLCAGLMASGTKIIELDLSDNAFGPNGVVGVTDLLASNTCCTLEILRMNNQGLGHGGCRHLTEALEQGRRSSGEEGLLLKVFSGGRNRLEDVGANLLSKVFMDMGSLEELSLYQNGIGIEGILSLVRVLKSNPYLRIVNFSDNSLTPKGGEAVAKALPYLTNLEELYLSDCILRSAGTRALASIFEDSEVTPNLKVLNLSGNEIKSTAGISLVLALGNKTNLKLLDLNANEFGRSGVRSIIETLDSVGLLHALPKPSSEQELNEETLGYSLYELAFDEDQGSEGEGDDQYLVDDDKQDDGSDYDGEEGENEVEDEYLDGIESSYEKVNYKNDSKSGDSVVNFSFREMQDKLEKETCLASKSEKSSKSGPFGPTPQGLFSVLSPTNRSDETDAASMRSKLWSSEGFGNLFNSNSLNQINKGNLFSPSIFTNKLMESTKTVESSNQLDENQLRTYLTQCLSSPQDKLSRDKLIGFLNTCELPKQHIIHPVILSCSQLSTPENVVRLSLKIAHEVSLIPSSRDSIMQLAVTLLLSVFTKSFDDNALTNNESVARATNCLLVYLGAVKPEKNSEDWHDIMANRLSNTQSSYFKLTKTLVTQFATQIVPSVRNCLTVLLTEQYKREQEGKNSVQLEKDAQCLRNDIINALEKQMSELGLS